LVKHRGNFTFHRYHWCGNTGQFWVMRRKKEKDPWILSPESWLSALGSSFKQPWSITPSSFSRNWFQRNVTFPLFRYTGWKGWIAA
jgi:hypothetical protein